MTELRLYRGTQRPEVQGRGKGITYTPSLPAAIIWSSIPPDVWSQRKAAFLPGSTVHVAELGEEKVLALAENNNSTGFDNILMSLGFGDPGGIRHDEALKILQYIHNRIVGKAPGGEFLYRVFDEEGNELDDQDLPFSLKNPMTLVGELGQEFEQYDSMEVASRLVADTFIFADVPAVQRVALRLGYGVLSYRDLFDGVETVSDSLLGIPADQLNGVEAERDLKHEKVYTIDAYRALTGKAIRPIQSILTRDLLCQVNPEELKAAP